MKIAQVLLVHKNPGQVARLIERLSHPDVDCWVHIDKKNDSPGFQKAVSMPNTFLVQPNKRVDWGCYNTVEAMLQAMRTIIPDKKYEYVNFISGQDYPLQPPSSFLDYLNKNIGYEFMGCRPYEDSSENISRIHKYHFNNYSFAGVRLFERVINRMGFNRKFPYPFEIKKGPQWMSLTRNAVQYILEFVDTHPDYCNYFKMVHIPDEFFFQTLLYNSPFRQAIRDQVFHYADWSEMKPSPKVFTCKDFEGMKDYKVFLDHHIFFARKFDSEVDTAILDLIDNEQLALMQ